MRCLASPTSHARLHCKPTNSADRSQQSSAHSTICLLPPCNRKSRDGIAAHGKISKHCFATTWTSLPSQAQKPCRSGGPDSKVEKSTHRRASLSPFQTLTPRNDCATGRHASAALLQSRRTLGRCTRPTASNRRRSAAGDPGCFLTGFGQNTPSLDGETG